MSREPRSKMLPGQWIGKCSLTLRRSSVQFLCAMYFPCKRKKLVSNSSAPEAYGLSNCCVRQSSMP